MCAHVWGVGRGALSCACDVYTRVCVCTYLCVCVEGDMSCACDVCVCAHVCVCVEGDRSCVCEL